MNATLDLTAICDLLASLDAVDRNPALEEVVMADIAAKEAGFPACLVARDTDDIQRLVRLIPTGNALPCQLGRLVWEPEHLRAVERAGTLVVLTFARQIVPGILDALLNHADRVNAPVAVFVDGMGRVGNPQSLKVADELAKNLKQTTWSWCALGDARFAGPSLTEALEANVAVDIPQRTRVLLTLRRRETHDWVQHRLTIATAALQEINESFVAAREMQNASTIVARAKAGAARQHFSALSNHLRAIDPDQVWAKVRAELAPDERIRRTVSETKVAVKSALDAGVAEVDSAIRAEGAEFMRMLRQDTGAQSQDMEERFGKRPETVTLPDYNAVADRLKVKLDQLVIESIDQIILPVFVSRLAGLLPQRKPAPQQGPVKQDEQATADGDEQPEHDENQETTPEQEKEPNPLETILRKLPERVLDMQLERVVRESIEQTVGEIDARIAVIVSALDKEITAIAATSYTGIDDALRGLREEGVARVERLADALRRLE